MAVIPVVDFAPYYASDNDPDKILEAKISLASRVVSAFENVGFMYVVNHGIPQRQVDEILQTSKEFFLLDSDVKMKYRKPKDINHGWLESGRESLNPKRPADLKEAYNYTPDVQNITLPTEEIATFKNTFQTFWASCTQLSLHILEIMAQGLSLEIRQLTDCHKLIGEQGNSTAMRSLYYPGLVESSPIQPDQVRCGEHSDYGSFTLLFQDSVGGLEVRTKQGDYIQVPPLEGSIVVNIGDLMQRWTADRLTAAKHRVLIPTCKTQREQTRQSLAFFVQPDDDIMIKCLDNSDKYEPINSREYLMKRFDATYQDKRS